MKTILSLLLTCVASFAATTYPVITDNANRQFTGGATNLSLLNGTNVFGGTNRYTGTVIITNAASTLSGNGAGMTNLSAGNIASGSLSDARLSANVPLLNGTNVFTGTNTFTASKFYPANGIGVRTLWTSTSNFFTGTLNTNTYSQITNAGGNSSGTCVLDLTLPALVGSNSLVTLSYTVWRPAAGTQNTVWCFYAGSNTNFFGFTSQIGTSPTYASSHTGVQLFANSGSFTNQRVAANVMSPIAYVPGTAALGGTTNILDTSVPWKFRMDVCCTNSSAAALTNLNYQEITILEWIRN